jgi:hypothetical protein
MQTLPESACFPSDVQSILKVSNLRKDALDYVGFGEVDDLVSASA